MPQDRGSFLNTEVALCSRSNYLKVKRQFSMTRTSHGTESAMSIGAIARKEMASPAMPPGTRGSMAKLRPYYLHRVIMSPPPGHEVIFKNHDRLDCRRENLRIATREEARQHHRMRIRLQDRHKGVRYNDESDTYSAYIYRNGHAYHVGTFYFREQAEQAYEAALKRENPDLHSAPATVERRPAEGATEGCSASAA